MRGELTKSATELIVDAMEHADEMGEVVVVYRLKNSDDRDGFCWLSNVEDTLLRMGMMTAASEGMFEKAFGEPE